MPKQSHICQHCGKSFEVYPCQKNRFCSQECYFASRRKGSFISCQVCGKKFWGSPAKVETRKTCSLECFREYRKRFHKMNTEYCAVCRKPFHFYPSSRRNARYCSRACQKIDQVEGNQRRGLRLKLYNLLKTKKCAICGWEEAPTDLCHIVPQKEGGSDSLENLIFLCPNHHRMLDYGRIQREHLISLRTL